MNKIVETVQNLKEGEQVEMDIDPENAEKLILLCKAAEEAAESGSPLKRQRTLPLKKRKIQPTLITSSEEIPVSHPLPQATVIQSAMMNIAYPPYHQQRSLPTYIPSYLQSRISDRNAVICRGARIWLVKQKDIIVRVNAVKPKDKNAVKTTAYYCYLDFGKEVTSDDVESEMRGVYVLKPTGQMTNPN